MKKILLIILITFPLWIFSQGVTTKGGETILSKEKTIDLAKIVKNEERLQLRVDSLQDIIIRLNDSIQSAASKINQSISTIEKLSDVISNQYNEIITLKDNQQSFRKPEIKNYWYGYMNPGTNFKALKTVMVKHIKIKLE